MDIIPKLDDIPTFKDCVEFAEKSLIFTIATVEDGQPHVRMGGFWKADETGFYGVMPIQERQFISNS